MARRGRAEEFTAVGEKSPSIARLPAGFLFLFEQLMIPGSGTMPALA
jgi:hypothetical protein